MANSVRCAHFLTIRMIQSRAASEIRGYSQRIIGSIILEERLKDPESLEAEKMTPIQMSAGAQLARKRLIFRTRREVED